MRKYIEILRKCPLFDNISDENILPMLDCLNAKVLTFKKGEIIMDEGTQAKNLGIVLCGEVQIIRVDFYGNRNIISNIDSPNLFAEAFACANIQSLPVKVVSVANSTVMTIDCQRITQTCTNACDFHNKIIFNLLKIMAIKNVLFNQKSEITSKRTTREKLLAYLVQQATLHNSKSFAIPFNRQELADYIEVDRSGLSAEISKLRTEGVLECEKNWFKLL